MSDHPISEDAYVARQPIFDRNEDVVGYELLYRNGPQNLFPTSADPDGATCVLIDSCLHVHDLETLVGKATPFVNVTENLLCGEALEILPRGTVLEILKTVPATAEILEACRRLSAAGYTIALDNFMGEVKREPFIEAADILKVNFKETRDPAQRRAVAERYGRLGKALMADKVETREDAQFAKNAGYTLFQGFFFSEPQIEVRRDIPRFKQNYLLFLQALRQPVLDMERIEQLISNEVSLSVRLLKYMNSCAFGLRREVTSIGQALVYLGERPLRRWGSLVAITGLGDDRPRELVVTTLIRARFCELLGDQAGMRQGEPFLVGLVSSLAALLGRPQEEVLAEIGVGDEIVRALKGDESKLGRLFAAVSAYERGDWTGAADSLSSVFQKAHELMTVPAHYREAVSWARTLMDASGQAA